MTQVKNITVYTVKVHYTECPGPDLFWINDMSGVQILKLQKSTMIKRDVLALKIWYMI
jgi:hypothetical protein